MVKQRETQINRRELLNLDWLASLGFVFVNLGGVTILFAYPRFREGEFGGQFVLGKAGKVFPAPMKTRLIIQKGNFGCPG